MRCDAEDEPTGIVDADTPLYPAALGALELRDREDVQNLVGDDDRGAARHSLQRREFPNPAHGHTLLGEGLALHGLELGIRLDEHDLGRSQKGRHLLRGAQGICDQRAASRTELHEAHARGRAHLLPDDGRPEPDQLAEDLRDLGRRDEILFGTDGAARAVVAVLGIIEAGVHVRADRDRPVAGDAGGKCACKRCRLGCVHAVFGRQSTMKATTPKRAIGIE